MSGRRKRERAREDASAFQVGDRVTVRRGRGEVGTVTAVHDGFPEVVVEFEDELDVRFYAEELRHA